MEMKMKVRKERIAYLKKDAVQGFTKHIGLIPKEMSAGKFVTRVRLTKALAQQDGFAHAGLIATLADHTAGYATFTLVPPDRRILTVEFKINYLKPAAGPFIECRAKVIKPGKQILVAEAEVYSINGRNEYLAAKALLTMASVPKEKVENRK
jgi:uncharacterized protein (TIGR00369 family)